MNVEQRLLTLPVFGLIISNQTDSFTVFHLAEDPCLIVTVFQFPVSQFQKGWENLFKY